MRALFLLVFGLGLCYFVAVRRGTDFYTLAFASSAIYFSPGLAGYDATGDPLATETYAVFLLVLGALWVAGAVRPPRALVPARETRGHAPAVVAALVLLALGLVLATSGVGALFRSKLDQDFVTPAPAIWRVTASLAVIYGVTTRRWGVLATGLLGLLLMFLASDRTAVAMTAAALGIEVVGRRRGVPPVRAARAFVVPLLVAIPLVWGGKLMHVAIRDAVQRGSLDHVAAIARDPAAQRMLTSGSEPFLTQALLNRSIRRDLHIGPRHLVGVVYQLWPVPSMFGHPSHEFNDILQERLFPTARKNTLAYNFWAEALVSGGWLLLLVYVALYLGGLELANAGARSPSAARRGIWLLMGAYWAFYLHRNALASIVAYEKQILALGLLGLLGGWLLAGGSEAPAQAPAAPPAPLLPGAALPGTP